MFTRRSTGSPGTSTCRGSFCDDCGARGAPRAVTLRAGSLTRRRPRPRPSYPKIQAVPPPQRHPRACPEDLLWADHRAVRSSTGVLPCGSDGRSSGQALQHSRNAKRSSQDSGLRRGLAVLRCTIRGRQPRRVVHLGPRPENPEIVGRDRVQLQRVEVVDAAAASPGLLPASHHTSIRTQRILGTGPGD